MFRTKKKNNLSTIIGKVEESLSIFVKLVKDLEKSAEEAETISLNNADEIIAANERIKQLNSENKKIGAFVKNVEKKIVNIKNIYEDI